MSVSYSQFQGEIVLTAKIHAANPSLATVLQAVATSLGSDTTTHDWTIDNPAPALKFTDSAANPTTYRLTNDLLLSVNWGKGGNLPNASMIAALDGVAGVLSPPGVVDIPYVSGTGAVGQVLSCTTGNWVGTPTSYTYQWTRDGANIAGATSATYTLVSADSGHAIACVVTATNATGSTAAPPSNAINCA